MRSDTVTCMRCKKKIMRSRLLESLKLMKNGAYGVKGQCWNCGHFICWIPQSESHTYGKLYEAEHKL